MRCRNRRILRNGLAFLHVRTVPGAMRGASRMRSAGHVADGRVMPGDSRVVVGLCVGGGGLICRNRRTGRVHRLGNGGQGGQRGEQGESGYTHRSIS